MLMVKFVDQCKEQEKSTSLNENGFTVAKCQLLEVYSAPTSRRSVEPCIQRLVYDALVCVRFLCVSRGVGIAYTES